jgi:hypothetical protein
MPSICTAKHVGSYFNEGVLPKPGAAYVISAFIMETRNLIWEIRCDIDMEYLPSRDNDTTSRLNELSQEDLGLLSALQGLASVDISNAFPLGVTRALRMKRKV